MSHDEYIKRRDDVLKQYGVLIIENDEKLLENPDFDFRQLHDRGHARAQQAIDKLVLELVASAKPAEYQAESWQQGLEKKAFDDAVRVYEYKLTTIVKGAN